MRQRLSSISLITTFAVVSLAAFTLLGLVLVLGTSALLRQQAESEARATAVLLTKYGVEEPLAGQLPAGGLSRAAIAAIDSAVDRGNSDGRVVRVWTADGSRVYSSVGEFDTTLDAPSGVGTAVADDGVRTEMREGEPAVGAEGAVLDVFVPVRGESGVSAVAQVTVPYADTQASVSETARQVGGLIVVGLLVVWLVLYRIMVVATNRLRKQSEENARLALHDPLTGLPNRRLLNERLERAALLRARTNTRVALLLLDLDRFKEVNDTLGHDHGDLLLVQVADRVSGAIRDMDTVARLGGDEFAVLLPSVGTVEDAEMVARRVLSVFTEPFDVNGLALHVDSSIGVALLPDHANEVGTLMQRADVAMYVAKSTHLGVATYSSQVDAHSTGRLVLLGDLRRALDTPDELEVYFQPKVNLASGEVVGLEALLRWHHPERGTIQPSEFVPLAERTGLIHPLSRRVLELVVAQLAEWDRSGREIPVSVNISGRNLNEGSLSDFLADLLDRHGVHPVLLELEISEGAVADDPDHSYEMLKRLSLLGIQITVDDFGTGYTSMAQLERMPLRALKIDRTLVWRMLEDPGGSVLVKAIIDLAHEFSLMVVAEGADSEAIVTELRRLGCDVAQGAHWAPPLEAAEVHEVIDRVCVARNRDKAPVQSQP